MQMGVEMITTLTDSRLASNEINGEFKARDKRMEKYVKSVQRIVEPFKEFIIKQILRGENRRANALIKG